MTEPFLFANGQIAKNVADLADICQNFPEDCLAYFNRGDFEGWLNYLGETSLAEKASKIRETDLPQTDKLQEFILACQTATVANSQTKPTRDTSTPVVSPERVERRFRIVYLPGKTKVRQVTMGKTSKIVSYQMFSKELQMINNTGGKVIDIQTV
ncbi:MAG: hypothetical protein EA365_00100 [Gloeocapsa sp. DLM2.Bin57]|nr:MAG: hypothetical protein EA365_00100 [Gloeocapsa sp. DLM2.Bin57]